MLVVDCSKLQAGRLTAQVSWLGLEGWQPSGKKTCDQGIPGTVLTRYHISWCDVSVMRMGLSDNWTTIVQVRNSHLVCWAMAELQNRWTFEKEGNIAYFIFGTALWVQGDHLSGNREFDSCQGMLGNWPKVREMLGKNQMLSAKLVWGYTLFSRLLQVSILPAIRILPLIKLYCGHFCRICCDICSVLTIIYAGRG